MVVVISAAFLDVLCKQRCGCGLFLDVCSLVVGVVLCFKVLQGVVSLFLVGCGVVKAGVIS